MTPSPTERPCCPIGARPDAAEIDAAIRGGEQLRAIGARYGVLYHAIQKHRLHALQSGSQPGTTGAQSASTAGQSNIEPRPVLEDARRLQRRASKLLRKLENGELDVDVCKAAAAMVGQIKAALSLQAQILGEIKAASTTVNVFNSPDYKEFEGMLADALIDYPEAADAVLRVIRERRSTQPLH